RHTTTSTRLDTLSLHDALPISRDEPCMAEGRAPSRRRLGGLARPVQPVAGVAEARDDEASLVEAAVDGGRDDVDVGVLGVHLLRSEEHTSELQSRENRVCRLPL